MKRRPILAGCILSILFLLSFARAQTTFQRTYGGEADDGGYSITLTPDGGYVIAGRTRSFGAGSHDVWLIKTDSLGDTTWTRTYGGTDWDNGNSVIRTRDGGYAIVGGSESYFPPVKPVWLVRTNADGDTIWTQHYGGNGEEMDEVYSIEPTDDGGFVMAGTVWNFESESEDAWLIRTDSAGDTLWTRAYATDGESYTESGGAARPTFDGGYILVGGVDASSGQPEGMWVIKTDPAGDTVWTRVYPGGEKYRPSCSVLQTADSGYVIAGLTDYGIQSRDLWLLRLNANGDTVWTRTYGGSSSDGGNSIQPTADGGYIIAGHTASFGSGSRDVWLLKTDADGDTTWTRTFGGLLTDEGYSVQQTPDRGFIVVGTTKSLGAGSEDVYLVKTDSLGYATGIAEPQLPVTVTPKPLPTILRNVLVLPGNRGNDAAPTTLMDISGRRVMNISPGPNDISHLSPGVYFVRPPVASRYSQPATKVVIQR